MVILALDTTSGKGSCALLRGSGLLREAPSDASKPQAARLPGELASLLEAESLALRNVDALAVGIGPGSFTGLRVGIATMQGLALALDRPLVGVSALDALARLVARAHAAARVAAWVDAWRGEVFAVTYEQGRAAGAPVVARPDHLLRALPRERMLFVGNGAALHAAEIREALGPLADFAEPLSPPLAGAMGELAAEILRAGHRPKPHAIRPLYVRRSDAELARAAARDRGAESAARARS